ncbi:hypothetical protein JH06_4602 [Blastocystis sp. subtype 4]|uniref:hypothetical protein n=1 Tax=Blastocystis sp. subtype 4 TaxID=944170 RepID=UPI0007113B30|nr:hypothetical protein JH06_4602 [Blastocystis sp. subtype 4]KNB41873.1 hypothetical protein JH06_4602 [Blastocystis sp. subtype 4]|eukprot:XP_014525316.1 hypothetical protein JH06_4602 [Blastocystis sp. subtype 4]
MASLTGLLNQINDMIIAMGPNVPLNTIKKITDLIMNNPPIFTQACDLIERSMASATVQNKKPLLYLLDYMFKTIGRKCTDYFISSISTIIASYFESANNEMRSKMGSIVGLWARQRTFPAHVIEEIVKRVSLICQDAHTFDAVWNQSFNNGLYGNLPRQQVSVRSSQPTVYRVTDYMDDENLGELSDDDDLNPLFTINKELLDQQVYPTVRSHLDFIKQVIRYQTEQNKLMGVKQATPIVPKIPTDVVTSTTKVYSFDNWNDTDKLLVEGRQLLHDIEKEPEDNRYYAMCPGCGIVFKKENEYTAHVILHHKVNEDFEAHRQYRGWYKTRSEWVLRTEVEIPKEETEEKIQYVEYDVNRCYCGFCGEKLEYVELDDSVRKGWFFKDAVEPVKGGPVYHVDCLRLQEAEKQKKREEKKRDIQMKKEEPEVKPEVITKKEDFEDLISFD